MTGRCEDRLARFADKKPFQDWDPGDLRAAFGARRIYDYKYQIPRLSQWIRHTYPIAETYEPLLEHFRLNLKLNRSAWNETELRFGFIGPCRLAISGLGARFDFETRA
ncbi:MAG: hypothetical protein RMM53_06555 [Bacteroidia bacterium]|nr:hypothetical protein [Bacteroidia bacterium]MDW8333858.1 hypothetical protein [Bacteroidia bacterium]